MEIKILLGAAFPHQQVPRLLWFRGITRYVYKMRSSKAVEGCPSLAAEVRLRAQSPQGLGVQTQDSQSSCPFPGPAAPGCPWGSGHAHLETISYETIIVTSLITCWGYLCVTFSSRGILSLRWDCKGRNTVQQHEHTDFSLNLGSTHFPT